MVRIPALLFFFNCFSFLLSPNLGYGQERCGTVEYEKFRRSKIPKLETEVQFEQWMQKKLAEGKLRTFQTGRTEANQYTIPVVVHVIHNGEAVGAGTNIPDAQIISQIQVINDDYKRLNADKVSTPAEFQPVAGSIDIQFVLAKQDPEGLATTGITRTLGTKTSWSSTDTEFKSLSYWPAENYLNMWVINLSGNLLGFAQLPTSTTLPGLEDSSSDRLTDGVAIDYQAFGSTAGGNFDLQALYNKGRTATHEIGHFLGLRHIWGDDSNCATDYVDDTPPQSSSTSGCPTNPQNSCGGHKMFQNYLDYSSDACMNIFTQGQVARMMVVLQGSPRRTSLLTSPGASDPVVLSIDLGILQIITPQNSLCSGSETPVVEVKNYGTTTVTSAQVQLSVNGSVVETKTFTSLSIANLQSANLTFNPLSFGVSSTQQVAFQILQTNGTADGKTTNNSASVQVITPANASLPITEPFNTTPSNWQIINPDGNITWANVVAPDNNPSNRAMKMNLNEYQITGALDWLVTPAFSLTIPLNAQLKFDLSHAQFPGYNDEMKVYALPGCNHDLSKGILLWSKTSSTGLSTTSSTSNPFTPTSDAQWRKSEVIPLGALTTSTHWQLAFVSKNANGNNLYVDNAVVSDGLINDVALTSIVSPSLVHCHPNPEIRFTVKNFSTAPITSFQVQRTLNGGTIVTQNFSNFSLAVGVEQTFLLSAVVLSKGLNQIVMTVVNPNGFVDSAPANNTITFNSYLDQSVDETPLRLTFDNPAEIPWLVATPVNSQSWVPVNTNKNQSITYKAFSNATLGEESWMVSPVLDLTRYPRQSLLFDVSYAQKIPADDRLKILGSSDCGLTYNTVLLDRAGSEFSITNTTSPWVPVSNTDWKREYVSLDSLAGNKNIRLAFVVTNAHGNNIYLDNLEIFAGDDVQPPVSSLPYQIYYSNRTSQADLALTFSLPEKEEVRLQIFSIMGQIVSDINLGETLNQTYYFDLSQQATGLYMFRLQIADQVSTTKVYVGH